MDLKRYVTCDSFALLVSIIGAVYAILTENVGLGIVCCIFYTELFIITLDSRIKNLSKELEDLQDYLESLGTPER